MEENDLALSPKRELGTPNTEGPQEIEIFKATGYTTSKTV